LVLASPARARLRRAEAKKTPSGKAERGEAASPLGNNVIKHNNRHADKEQNDDVKFNLHGAPRQRCCLSGQTRLRQQESRPKRCGIPDLETDPRSGWHHNH
jgi:ribosomal protein L34E